MSDIRAYEDKKKAYAPLHFNQPMVTQADVVVTVCADVNRFNHWCEINGADKSLNNFLFLNIATIDATIAAQAITTAAESKGLGVCWLGTVNYMADEISKFLNLPNGVVPVACLTIGVPDENPELTERLPLSAIVHKEDNGDFYLDFECDLSYINDIVENNILVANTPQGDQAFRIGNVSKTKYKILTKAKHVFYDSQNYLIADSYVVDKDCAGAMYHLNAATEPASPFATFLSY